MRNITIAVPVPTKADFANLVDRARQATRRGRARLADAIAPKPTKPKAKRKQATRKPKTVKAAVAAAKS